MHVKRNCTTVSDIEMQSAILKERFIEKGYDHQELDRVINEIKDIPQEDCLGNSTVARTRTDLEWSFISSFHSQYKEVESIFKTHWHVLSLDKPLILFYQKSLSLYTEKLLMWETEW